MNRLRGNRGKQPDDNVEVINDYNECVAEVKEENPYVGQLALHQEAMKRVAQRRAAKYDNNQNNAKEDSTPQRIAFNRRAPRKNNNNGNSLSNSLTRQSQSLSRSFIGFLNSSTNSYNTVKVSNKTKAEESHGNNTVMPGRRISTYNEEDAVHVEASFKDIELSDSEQEEDGVSDDESKNSRSSSFGRRLSSFKRIPSLKGKRHSAHKRQSSSNSSISTLQRYSSDISKDSTAEKSVESRNGDDEKPQHKPPENNNNNNTEDSDEEKEEKEVMDFVEKFLANGGSVSPALSEKKPAARVRGRRSSLFSVEEDKVFVTSGESVSRSITSLGEGSVVVAADGSLICSWGRRSLNDSELLGDGGDLICNWDSRRSILSNSSAASNSDGTQERREFPREINVGINADDR
jgi:hypothetical protein